LGVEVTDSEGFAAYAQRYLYGKQVFLKFDAPEHAVEKSEQVRAYVYLKNRIFVNAYLLKAGLARPSGEAHRLSRRFATLWQERQQRGNGRHG